MPRVNVELNIPRESVEQPIVWRLGKLFNVVTNVRQARVSSEYGVVSLDIEGSTAEVEQAVAYLKGIGVVEGESSTTSPTPPESGEITPNSIAVRLRTVNPLQATAPILCRVARDYRVVVNICYAALDQEEGGSRRGHGQETMFGHDRSAADIERRADDGADIEQVEGQAGADDIGDGIGRAHLVEMDLLDGHLVDLRFGFAETAEDGDGIAAGAFGDVGLFDRLDDVGKVAVNVRLLHLHVVLGSADAATLNLLKRNRGTALERGNGIGNGVLVRAGIRQRAHQHVAADSRKCIQIAS